MTFAASNSLVATESFNWNSIHSLKLPHHKCETTNPLKRGSSTSELEEFKFSLVEARAQCLEISGVGGGKPSRVKLS